MNYIMTIIFSERSMFAPRTIVYAFLYISSGTISKMTVVSIKFAKISSAD